MALDPELVPEDLVTAERELRDREAPLYDGYRERFPWAREVMDACLQKALELAPEQTVVDAGSGTGPHLSMLLEDERRVVAIDHSERSLDIARARVSGPAGDRLDVRRGDLRSLPVEDGVADRVLCSQAIQHLPTAEHRRTAARELLRVLRPGGVLVVSAYRWRGHVWRHKEGLWGGVIYRYAFTSREFRRLFREAGFDEVEVAGSLILPRLAMRLRMSVANQVKLAFGPVGRHLAHYVVARAVRGDAPGPNGPPDR